MGIPSPLTPHPSSLTPLNSSSLGYWFTVSRSRTGGNGVRLMLLGNQCQLPRSLFYIYFNQPALEDVTLHPDLSLIVSRVISKTAAMPQNDCHDMQVLKAEANKRFGRVPGVLGFGLGNNSLRVYVQSPNVKKFLPEKFKGINIDLVVTGEIVLQVG